MPSHNNHKQQTVFSTLRDDLRSAETFKTFRKESKEIRDFYLTPEQRAQLKQMKRMKRSFFIAGWVLKAMFFKLTPFRRLLFVVGILMVLTVRTSGEGDVTINGNAWLGGMLLVLVILLELKDKLLAHDELEEGRHIQELLMPERTPTIEGWSAWLYTRSANEVCGDLIDFLRMENGRIGIAIADVAGKGLHAALLTAKLQSTIRALAFHEQSVSSLVSKVNTIFHRDSPSHLFASLFYVEISEHDSSVRYVNAGHLPALIARHSAVEETGKGDPALGLVRTVNFSEQHTTLNSGDLLVLYSDGLTEAKNERGEFFGKERLVKIIQSAGSSEQVGNSILHEIDSFIGTTSASDDLSLVILQKK
jgi:sigma-B regulation protein RsbU (phosphoserine phosphatase)